MTEPMPETLPSPTTTAAEQGMPSYAPSLYEMIETRRFLGREFLAWLWFEASLFEMFEVGEFGKCQIVFDKSMTLETSKLDEVKEKSTLVGLMPSESTEAIEALRNGKLPTKCKVTVYRDEETYSFTIDGNLALSSVKIPAVIKGDGDPFYERISLIEAIEGAVEALYYEFLELRVGGSWEKVVMPAISLWMKHEGRAAEIGPVGAIGAYLAIYEGSSRRETGDWAKP